MRRSGIDYGLSDVMDGIGWREIVYLGIGCRMYKYMWL